MKIEVLLDNAKRGQKVKIEVPLLTVTQEGFLKFSEVFNPIIFENERGERISVCQSDGGFEVKVVNEMTRTPPRRLLHVLQ